VFGRGYARFDPQVRAELVDNTYRSSGLTLLVEPVAAAAIATCLWSNVDTGWVAGWLTLSLASTALRSILWQRYRMAPPIRQQCHFWGWLLVLSFAGAGIIWGAAITLLAPDASLITHVALFGIIGFVSAALCGVSFAFTPTAYAFILCELAVMVRGPLWRHGADRHQPYQQVAHPVDRLAPRSGRGPRRGRGGQ
jgi:hypothetical protein